VVDNLDRRLLVLGTTRAPRDQVRSVRGGL